MIYTSFTPVYVLLGLVERKKVSRRREDVSQGSLLYEETEITQKFEQGAFLEQVLRLGQSPRSGERRIAAIATVNAISFEAGETELQCH